MKPNLLVPFLFFVAMMLVLRHQGKILITPLSPLGILDLEFSRTASRFAELSLFWNFKDVRLNIYLDFLFIAAYSWLLVRTCIWIRKLTKWNQWCSLFLAMSVAAGSFDICENFLLLLVMLGRFDPAILELVFYCALLKFILAAMVVVFIVGSAVVILTKRISR